MPSIILNFGESGGANCPVTCNRCKTETVLVTTSQWTTHPEDIEDQELVELDGETSGNYCPTCNILTAVFIHTPPEQGAA